MIDRQLLLSDLKPLVRELEADLRSRCGEVPQINDDLKKEYELARTAGRTGITFEEWRADLITQVAVAWVLSCVFVRFLEDNGLIAPSRISGKLHGAGKDCGLARSRDEWDLYLHSTPNPTHRGYLLKTFDDLVTLPGTKDVFGPHNPVSACRNWLSGDAAQKLIEFFQRIDAEGSGEIVHDFTDKSWDTRFLGDLYQDLSEAARKKYALLQTPIFVEEFILERTLEPAIREFGLKDFRMIDPACGSGHFLLGAFTRILQHWRAKEPAANDRELVNRALAAVYGVDLNPYAVAIARFRLLLAAMGECQADKLDDAPAFAFNLVCGDSLLHGSPGEAQHVLGFHDLAHAYQSEDLSELKRILKPGGYNAVVANPPYITVKDKALNQAYRDRYPEVCYMKYSLSVPFMQRLFVLVCDGGYAGQITANSFMKREFGKKLVESYLPRIDMTHVIDTSGAYIPGHGTPTVILLGRNRNPVAQTIRAVMGIKGEPATPADPATGLAWTSITQQIDQAGSQSAFVSVNDTPREQFETHPWCIGGGGAAELKELLDEKSVGTLGETVDVIGIFGMTNVDEIMFAPKQAFARNRVEASLRRPLITGDQVRDWIVDPGDYTLFPYNNRELLNVDEYEAFYRWAWHCRTVMGNRATFNKQTYFDEGRPWWAWHQVCLDRLDSPLTIIFGCVATHNQFVLDRGGSAFNRHAPLIKLPPNASLDQHLGLVGLLNSSVACFWMKQVFNCKGLGGQGGGIKPEDWHRAYEFDGTKLANFPIPRHDGRLTEISIKIDQIAQEVVRHSPSATILETAVGLRARLERAKSTTAKLFRQIAALQEELDWLAYVSFGLIDEYHSPSGDALEEGLHPQDRPVEGLLRSTIRNGTPSIFYEVHKARGADRPGEMHSDMKANIERRRRIIESNSDLALIETPNHKRRWQIEPWEQQQERALRGWLLDRLESYFDFDGRMNDRKTVTARAGLRQPHLTSVAKVADLARADKDFMQVAEIYTGRMDFDVGTLAGELIAVESVPTLPVLRYKPAAADKRRAWERTWELQRLEDAVEALFEIERLQRIPLGQTEESLQPLVERLPLDDKARDAVLCEAAAAAGYVTEAVAQFQKLTSEAIIEPVHEAARRAKKAAVGDIPVPPKYTSADFASSDFWRLRGKLDVPKERWVSFPYCEAEDGTLVVAWAGYDQLQLARAIAERYEQAKEHEGRKLVPLLAAIGQLIPWLKQWHNEPDPAFGGTRMGDYFAGYLAEEAKALDMSVEQVLAWTPPEKPKKGGAPEEGGYMNDEKVPETQTPEASQTEPVVELLEPDSAAPPAGDATAVTGATSPLAADREAVQEFQAITRAYQELHAKCGAIVRDSLQGEYVQMMAKSHFFAQELERWVEAIAPNKEQYLLAVAVREYQYALLANAQGLYRQAFKGIRLVLELCLQAIHLSAHQVELQEWLESRKDTVWDALMDEQNGVLSVRFARAFFPDLEVDVRHYRGLAKQLYRECSECVHGSMQKYIPLPNSLEFSTDSFRLWHGKASGVALVVAFALSLRYLRDMKKEHLHLLEHDLLDRLGHSAAIRRHLGGPEGG